MCSNPPCVREATAGKCEKCYRVRYCSTKCRDQHWPIHKADCKLISHAFKAAKKLEKEEVLPPVGERGICVVSKESYIESYGKKGWKAAQRLHEAGERVPEQMAWIHAEGQPSPIFSYIVPALPKAMGRTAEERYSSYVLQSRLPTVEETQQQKSCMTCISRDPSRRTPEQQAHLTKLQDIAVSAIQKNRNRTDVTKQIKQLIVFMQNDLESKLSDDEVKAFRARIEGPVDPKFYSEDPEYRSMASSSTVREMDRGVPSFSCKDVDPPSKRSCTKD